MPRAALTVGELDAFRGRAVATATRLFAERGYRGVTLRSLAKELAVSPMTPYRYFENKEELFAMARTEAFRRFADVQRDAEQTRAFSYLLTAVTAAVDAGLLEGEPLTRAHYLWAQLHGLVSLHLAGKLIMGRSFQELISSVVEKPEAAQ